MNMFMMSFARLLWSKPEKSLLVRQNHPKPILSSGLCSFTMQAASQRWPNLASMFFVALDDTCKIENRCFCPFLRLKFGIGNFIVSRIKRRGQDAQRANANSSLTL